MSSSSDQVFDTIQRLLITQVMPGMVVAQPVVVPGGTTLVGPGTKLSAAVIQKLALRGVRRIAVVGTPLRAPSQDPFKEQQKRLNDRFSRVIRHKPTMTIAQTIEHLLVKHS